MHCNHVTYLLILHLLPFSVHFLEVGLRSHHETVEMILTRLFDVISIMNSCAAFISAGCNDRFTFLRFLGRCLRFCNNSRTLTWEYISLIVFFLRISVIAPDDNYRPVCGGCEWKLMKAEKPHAFSDSFLLAFLPKMAKVFFYVFLINLVRTVEWVAQGPGVR